MKVGLKPSLATTTAKASERVVADPLGWERDMMVNKTPPWQYSHKPGTQCHTSATPLREQPSKLRVSDPRNKTVHKKCAVYL